MRERVGQTLVVVLNHMAGRNTFSWLVIKILH